MPEGDVLVRTAAALERWLAGREVTAASTSVRGFTGSDLVGRRVEKVEALGKHLVVRFQDGSLLHTELRMTGSWDLYGAGAPWRRPASQACLTLECGDRLAVCFNTPVVELLRPGGEPVHPAGYRLGTDAPAQTSEVDEVVRRARGRPPSTAVGELLLDETVMTGVGNIWLSEALFVEGLSPWTPVGDVPDAALRSLLATAARLVPGSASGAARPRAHAVYRRPDRPCPRCGTPVASQPLGEQAWIVYWCPVCQPS
jgi:endonuclease-8